MPAPRAAAIAENIQQTRVFARVDRRLLFRPHPRPRGSRTSDPGSRQGARDVNSGRVITRALMLCALFTVPRAAFAQEAVLTGTITDSNGGVLPGVTITAVHTASGNDFVAVTDERGGYRIPIRIGYHRACARLPGFGTPTQGLSPTVC